MRVMIVIKIKFFRSGMAYYINTCRGKYKTIMCGLKMVFVIVVRLFIFRNARVFFINVL